MYPTTVPCNLSDDVSSTLTNIVRILGGRREWLVTHGHMHSIKQREKKCFFFPLAFLATTNWSSENDFLKQNICKFRSLYRFHEPKEEQLLCDRIILVFISGTQVTGHTVTQVTLFQMVFLYEPEMSWSPTSLRQIKYDMRLAFLGLYWLKETQVTTNYLIRSRVD